MVNSDGTGNIQHWLKRITDDEGYIHYYICADEDDPQRADWEVCAGCDGPKEDAYEMGARIPGNLGPITANYEECFKNLDLDLDRNNYEECITSSAIRHITSKK